MVEAFPIVIGVILFAFTGTATFAHIWAYRWAVLLCMLAVPLLWRFRRDQPWPAVVAWCYFVLHAGAFSMLPFYSADPQGVRNSLQLYAGYSLAAFLVVPAFLVLCFREERFCAVWRRTFVAAAVLLSVVVVVSPHPAAEVFLIHNPSMAACFIACAVPLLSWYLVPLAIGACVLAHSWIGAGAAVLAIAFRFCRRPWHWGAVVLAASAGMLVLYKTGHIHDNGRFAAWGQALTWWTSKNAWLWVFGAGSGSLPVALPILQTASAPRGAVVDVFLFMHSEPLQILFEQGIAGLMLAGGVYCAALWRARGPLLSALLVFGATALFNFPLRYPLPMIFGVCMVLDALLIAQDRGPAATRTAKRAPSLSVHGRRCKCGNAAWGRG